MSATIVDLIAFAKDFDLIPRLLDMAAFERLIYLVVTFAQDTFSRTPARARSDSRHRAPQSVSTPASPTGRRRVSSGTASPSVDNDTGRVTFEAFCLIVGVMGIKYSSRNANSHDTHPHQPRAIALMFEGAEPEAVSVPDLQLSPSPVGHTFTFGGMYGRTSVANQVERQVRFLRRSGLAYQQAVHHAFDNVVVLLWRMDMSRGKVAAMKHVGRSADHSMLREFVAFPLEHYWVSTVPTQPARNEVQAQHGAGPSGDGEHSSIMIDVTSTSDTGDASSLKRYAYNNDSEFVVVELAEVSLHAEQRAQSKTVRPVSFVQRQKSRA